MQKRGKEKAVGKWEEGWKRMDLLPLINTVVALHLPVPCQLFNYDLCDDDDNFILSFK